MPGQACTYKIGEIKILELRKLANETLGNLFSLKEFHKEILSCPASMEMLEKCIEIWLNKKKSKFLECLITI